MKKLNKLQINSERLMNNEELITLRGGYDGPCCWCYNHNFDLMGAMAAYNAVDCMDSCHQMGWIGFYVC